MGSFRDIDRQLEDPPPEVAALLASVEAACEGLRGVAPSTLYRPAADVQPAGIGSSRAAADLVLEMGRGPLSVRTILQSHRVLLDGAGEPRAGLPADGQRGMWLTELVAGYELAVSQRRHPPLFLVAAFVLDFAAVEPFEVGNRRMARLLLTRELLRHGYAAAPSTTIAGLAEAPDGWDAALAASRTVWETSEHDAWPWVSCVLGIVLDATRELERRADLRQRG